MIDPLKGMKTIRSAGKDDGIFVLMDIKCEDNPSGNKGSMVPFLYDNIFTEGKVKDYCKQVGFKTFKRIEIGHPLNSGYEIRPN